MFEQSAKLVIYGSYGYTGMLISELAAKSDLNIVLSGRNKSKLKNQADFLELFHQTADLSDPGELDALLKDAHTVLHCAGPFVHTWKPMAEACLRNGCNYLDITGEITVFEGLKNMGSQFKKAGLMAMPGVGFDVVPTDCLAIFLKEKLPDANQLELAFAGLGGGVSRGTAKSMAEQTGNGGAVRRNGKIKKVMTGRYSKKIDFGPKKLTAVSIPWGDISTAYTSTGIENITVYMAMTKQAISMLRLSNLANPILRLNSVRGFMKKRIEKKPSGPDREKREDGRSLFWGRVQNKKGEFSEARMIAPEGYTLTAQTSLLIAEKVLNGNFKPGYQSPATAYGKDLILQIEGAELIAGSESDVGS